MAYIPKPIDSSALVLPPELLALTERLARNTHDVWAAQRFKEGWTFGPKRNDELKKHPCLVPYAELPESEKQYDRNTAMQTLAAVLALGYEIRRK